MPAVQYTASQTSLVKFPSSLTEIYIPLWVYSSAICTSTSTSTGMFLQKGVSSALGAATTDKRVRLHDLNSNWLPGTKFVFEASIFSSNGSLNTAYAALYDMTTNTAVTTSQISTASQSAIVIRSGQFTLVPGHTYGVSVYVSNGSYYCAISKAHLVALMGV